MFKRPTQQLVKSIILGSVVTFAIAILVMVQPTKSLLMVIDAPGEVNSPVTIVAGVYADITCTPPQLATASNPIAPNTSFAFCYAIKNTGTYTYPGGYNLNDSIGGAISAPAVPLTPNLTFTVARAMGAGVAVSTTSYFTFSGVTPINGVFTSYEASGSATAHVQKPSILLEKTVGTSAGCSITDTLQVAVGTGSVNAVYCYRIINNGNVTVTFTGLTDDKITSLSAALGGILPATLPPNSALSPILVAQIINTTTQNIATLTATHAVAGITSPIVVTDSAIISYVAPLPAIKLNVYLTQAANCDTANSDTLTLPANSSVRICYVATNVGNATLYTHTLSIENGTQLLSGQLITLPVGATTRVSRGPISVTGSIGSQQIFPATWLAQEIFGAGGSSFESATVNIAAATSTPAPTATRTPLPGAATATPTPTPTSTAPVDILASMSGSTSVGADGNISYTIRLTNISQVTASNIVFTSGLPANAVLQGVVRGGSVTCPTLPAIGAIGGLIVCNIPTLTSGQFDELTIIVRPTRGANAVVVSSSVEASTSSPETNKANNTAIYSITIDPVRFYMPLLESCMQSSRCPGGSTSLFTAEEVSLNVED